MPLTAAGEHRLRTRTLRNLEAWLNTPMVVLSFAWLLLVVAELIWGTHPALDILGVVIWAVFVAEFLLRFTLAPNKAQFLLSNWLTVVALIVPAFRMFAALRFLRVARAARGLRLIRIVGTANRGMNALRKSMSRRGLGFVLLLTILLTFLGAAGMIAFEPASEVSGGFENYGGALWWTAMLLTTMGTDFWPRTPEGRLLCLLLAIYGFAVWGYITASLATFFVGQEARAKQGDFVGAAELASLHSEISALRKGILASSAQRPNA